MALKLSFPRYLGRAREGLGLNRWWFFVLLLSLGLNFSLGLGLVWLNTQKTNIGYSLKRLDSEVREVASLTSKLEVERDLLLSPYNLERKARAMGMGTAVPGQLRRLP